MSYGLWSSHVKMLWNRSLRHKQGRQGCCFLGAADCWRQGVINACAWVQATQLPCFQLLIDRLGGSNVDKVEVLMLHQLFQSLMLARLEARRQNMADPIRTIPDHIYALIRRCARSSSFTL